MKPNFSYHNLTKSVIELYPQNFSVISNIHNRPITNIGLELD